MNGRRKHPGQAPVLPPFGAFSKRPEPALTLEALCAEFLALDTRSKEEEDEAQKRLELELMDPVALARSKEEEEAAARQNSGQATANPAVLHAPRLSQQIFKLLLASTGLVGKKGPEKSLQLTA
ncbi:hypothetical protein PR003_g28118 [Phytophthora rubi]|uniref:Uncharacterized protein n=1 Tax=Phytophthora rubi TaxID=129364 RepID=A0A6A4BV13_9STRA|nr:hypothetical protein PR002_g27075 [Phytophthora rubi]KAE8971287.1 hypothetical protein PR001_g26936 [Phytophthora rubi]KAE9279856.1 hypothetical protein PR003_g28118 [Phytophthora rubi]